LFVWDDPELEQSPYPKAPSSQVKQNGFLFSHHAAQLPLAYAEDLVTENTGFEPRSKHQIHREADQLRECYLATTLSLTLGTPVSPFPNL
jgi:hypothetical protein